jgi:hypothetical protein
MRRAAPYATAIMVSSTPPYNCHAAPHEPIVTHRRSQRIQARNAKKTPFAPSTPKHHKICRDINVNRRSRRPSSPPLPQSSPYRGVFESSPYIFDDNFYNNGQINNGCISPDTATYGAADNRHKKHLRTAHETIINHAQLDDGWEPLDMPNPPRPLVRLLPISADVNNPFSFFSIFFGDAQFELLAGRTNKYAKHWLLTHPNNGRDSWYDCTANEIKIYFAILIYLGIQRNRQPKSHWDDPSRHSPIHLMKWRRYRLISHYFKVSDVDDDNGINSDDDDWHLKLHPLSDHLRETSQRVVVLGSQVSYDEMMVPYRGRSMHLTKCPNKPHPDGYKIWGLCQNGYLYDWLFFSGRFGTF